MTLTHRFSHQAKQVGAAILAAGLLAAGARAQVVTGSVPTAADPYAIAVNPVTNMIYVASITKNIVTVINGATNQTAIVSVGASPVAIDIDTSTNKVFVANQQGSSVTEIDGATNATTTIALHGTPESIAVNSRTHQVWAPIDTYNGSYTYGAVELIDEATGSVTDIDKGLLPAPLEITINPVTDKIYVADLVRYAITTTVIDGSDNSFENQSDATGPIAIDTTLDNVFVANLENGLIEIAGVTGFYSTVAGGSSVLDAVAVNQTTHMVYAAGGNGFNVFNEATGVATEPLVNVSQDSAIAIDETTNKIFVSTYLSPGLLSVVDGATDAVTTISVPAFVFAMAFNPNTGLLYVLSNDAAGTVTVVDARAGTASLVFSVQPISQILNAGSLLALSAVAGPGEAPSFQWSLNGTPLVDGAGISGSATSTLYVSNVSAASAGNYTCTISNAQGSTASSPASLTVTNGASPGHLVNLSCRAFVGVDGFQEQSDLIAGFVIGGQGSESVVLRGVGPGLMAYGVTGTAPSLSLSLFDTVPNLVTSDSAWQTPPTAPSGFWAGKAAPADATAADFQAVGAFALAPGSADAAVKVTLPAGAYTSVIAAPSGPYIALAEVYDADAPGAGTMLQNLSARAYVGSGTLTTVAGFVISGSTSQTILIRASGPALTAFGVANVIPLPALTLFNSSQDIITSNTGWQGNPEIAHVAASVGAFPWASPSSADSALLITLPPGNYTAQMTGAPSSTSGGTGLVEVYAVP